MQYKEGSANVPALPFEPLDKAGIVKWLENSPQSPIVVFVHGWRHNACDSEASSSESASAKVSPSSACATIFFDKKDAYECDPEVSDANLCRFRRFIAQVNDRLCPPAFGSDCARVKGVYAAWRGDSVDVLGLPDQLDVLTAFGREKASARVGEDGLSKTLNLIRGNFAQRYVVFVGHSFGANAIYNAISAGSQRPISDNEEFFLLNPAISAKEMASFEQTLQLPALERRLAPEGKRRITVIQAKNDYVVKSLFTLVYG